MNILSINAHPQFTRASSLSNQLMDFAHEKLREKDFNIHHINLYDAYIPEINDDMLRMWDQSRTGTPLSDELLTIEKRQRELLDLWKSHKNYIISAPLHNFSLPSKFIDLMNNLLVAGETFKYTVSGPKGLLDDGRKGIYIQSSGSHYARQFKYMNFDLGPRYMGAVFEMMGIQDLHVVRAQGTDVYVDMKEEIKERATEEIEFLFNILFPN